MNKFDTEVHLSREMGLTQGDRTYTKSQNFRKAGIKAV